MKGIGLICPAVCRVGCFCRGGFVRGPNGKCIPDAECPKTCPLNMIYSPCGAYPKCQATCTRPDSYSIPCPKICAPGCVCAKGFVLENGKCIPIAKCPKRK